MTKTLKQYIFRLMDEKGYVLDQDLYNFKKEEPNYHLAQQYKRLWHKLQYFKDYKFTEFMKGNRKYYARTAEMPENQWLQIPKELYKN
jgi:hypothetical protein